MTESTLYSDSDLANDFTTCREKHHNIIWKEDQEGAKKWLLGFLARTQRPESLCDALIKFLAVIPERIKETPEHRFDALFLEIAQTLLTEGKIRVSGLSSYGLCGDRIEIHDVWIELT